MADKNSKKKTKINTLKKDLNTKYQSSMRTAIKNVEKAIIEQDKKTAEKNLKIAVKRIDTAMSKGVVKKNYAARQKSRLTKKVNKVE